MEALGRRPLPLTATFDCYLWTATWTEVPTGPQELSETATCVLEGLYRVQQQIYEELEERRSIEEEKIGGSGQVAA